MYQSRHFGDIWRRFGDVLETFWRHLETFGDLIGTYLPQTLPVPTSPTLHLPTGSSGLNHPIYANHSNSTWRCSHYSLFIMFHGCTCYLFHKKNLQDHFVMQVKDKGSTN